MAHRDCIVSKNVGNATLIGTRPAISQAVNTATTDASCHNLIGDILNLRIPVLAGRFTEEYDIKAATPEPNG